MLVALIAVLIGIVFDQMRTTSIFISIAGKMLIMGAFIIGITAFLLFMREWFLGREE